SPTVPDNTTFEEAWRGLEKYNLLDKAPESILRRLKKGIKGKIPETPKENDKIFKKVYNIIIGSNIIALKAVEHQARKMGFNTIILTSAIEGEAREVAKVLSAIAKECVSTGNPVSPPACIISGGETTVTIKGKGKGGRNQELCLAAAIAMRGLKNVVLLSAGTDGTDGPTDAAGAIVDGTTFNKAISLGIDPLIYLKENDSYHFFNKIGDLLITGPTNTNVMDIQIILVGAHSKG
ncbi:glycerate kinase, partial [Candidatus Bathyarchaeota archaeon]